MSTPAKVGLVILLVAAVVGSGYLGAQAAAAQHAAVAAAVSMPRPAAPNAPSNRPRGPQAPARPQPNAPGSRPDRPGLQGPSGRGGRGSMMPGFRGPDARGFRGGRGQMMPGPRGFNSGGRRGNAFAAIPGGWTSQYRSQIQSAVAEALGISIEDYAKAIAAGQSPWQIAQSKGISAADFQAKMVDAMSVVLKQAVADGKLTQTQADAMIARMKQGGMPAWGGGPWGYPHR